MLEIDLFTCIYFQAQKARESCFEIWLYLSTVAIYDRQDLNLPFYIHTDFFHPLTLPASLKYILHLLNLQINDMTQDEGMSRVQ